MSEVAENSTRCFAHRIEDAFAAPPIYLSEPTGAPVLAGANARQVGGGHYKDMGVEPWDVVDTWPLEQQIGYYRGGALKYIMRMGTKDGRLQEARKGLHYQEKLVEVLTAAQTKEEDF